MFGPFASVGWLASPILSLSLQRRVLCSSDAMLGIRGWTKYRDASHPNGFDSDRIMTSEAYEQNERRLITTY